MKQQVFKLLILITVFCSLNQVYANTLPNSFTVVIPRPDGANLGSVTLNLSRYSIRDPNDFNVYLDQQNYSSAGHASGADKRNFNRQNVGNFPVRTYRGTVLEQPNSSVIAVIWPGNNSLSAVINEGKRILWMIEEISISIGNGTVSVNEPPGTDYSNISKINTAKSWDWVPTFNNEPTDLGQVSYPTVDRSVNHGWSIIPSLNNGIRRVQLAVDAEPEWFQDRAANDIEMGLAIIEHSVNVLDLVYVRDLSMSHVLTAYVQRTSTNLHTQGSDTIITWKDNGLGLNPGSSGASAAKSIPFQQLIWAYVNEGNPSAFRSQQPLSGGNYCRVPIKKKDASGMSHEVGHNWGGSHFIYPRDSMSGGGPWFGPTTVQRMIYLRDKAGVGAGLPSVSNQTYNWNVHPYATPDLVRASSNSSVDINVMGNDHDGNGDNIGIAAFDSVSEKGGTITQIGDRLRYTPPVGFTGRDTFMYLLTDGEFTSDAWVQVDVNNDLIARYRFETLGGQGAEVQDDAGADFHAELKNFDNLESLVNGKSGKGLKFPWKSTNDPDGDSARPYIDFGDIVDPFDGSHSVSLWVNFDSRTLNSSLPAYILANSSTAIYKLVSGYNIYTDGQQIIFEIKEQLTTSSTTSDGELRTITYAPSGGIAADQWYHLVLKINRNTDKAMAYVNNAQLGSVDLFADSFVKGKPAGGRYAAMTMGVSTYKPKKYARFAGILDELRFFSKPLSTADVNTLFNLGEVGDGGGTPPAAPTGVSATSGNGQVTLNWNDNTESDLSSYHVLRSTSSGGSYAQIANVSSSQYTDNNVTNGTAYYYVVRAVNNAGQQSASSVEVSATPNVVDDSVLINGVPKTNLSANYGTSLYYTHEVPAGASNLVIKIRNGTGNANLYVRFGAQPTNGSYDCRPKLRGNKETCTFSNPQAGTYHVRVKSQPAGFSGVTLTATHSP